MFVFSIHAKVFQVPNADQRYINMMRA